MLLASNRTARALAATAGLIAAGMLAACSSEAPPPEPPPSPSPAPTVSAPPPEPASAPLTGLDADGDLSHPALTVKIDNAPAARPQIGLERADVIVEELVEGGTTRYAVTWHSDVPEQVGPVRSVRPMDASIAGPYGGVFAYSGGQPQFIDAALASGAVNVIHDSGSYDDVFTRAPDRVAPHNLMLAGDEIVERNRDLDPPRELWAFADAEPTAALEGEDAALIDLFYSGGERRTWECGAGTWERSQNGVADLDANGGRLQAQNVIALTVQVRPAGGDVVESLLAGYSGEGVVSSGCSSVPVTWSQADVHEPIELVTADGAAVELAPGTTWIQLVPVTGSVTVS